MASNEWHYTINGQQAAAPASPAQLKQLAQSGKLQPTDLIWKEGMPNWVPASSIKGLFGSSQSLSPVKPPPALAPAAAEPEDMVPAEDDDGGGRRRAGGGGGGELFKRMISLNLSAAPVAAGERQQLASQGIAGDVAQRYLAWRRSMLLVVAVVTFAAAVWNTVYVFVNDFFSEKNPMNALGKMLEGLYLLSAFGLFGAALMGALLWSKWKLTRLVLGAAAVFSVVMPLVILFTPFRWMLSLPKGAGEGPEAELALKLMAAAGAGMVGMVFFIPQLLPAVISAGPGLIRACLRVKSLTPGAILPGWIAVVAAPLSFLVVLGVVLFAYTIVAAVGTILLLLGLMLLILAPLAYLIWWGKLVRPLRKSEAGSLSIMEAVAAGTAALGAILVIVFFLTLGSGSDDKKGSGGLGPGPGRIGGGRGRNMGPPTEDKKDGPPGFTALAIRVWVDYLGRSLFMTVVAADFLLAGVALGWRNAQRYAKTQDGPAHEQALTELEAIAAPPAADKQAKRRKIEPGDYPPEDEA